MSPLVDERIRDRISLRVRRRGFDAFDRGRPPLVAASYHRAMTRLTAVAFVPIRHVSERVPGKNYRSFNGRPLFHHIVTTLLRVDRIREVVIDTDSPTVIDSVTAEFPDVRVVQRADHLCGGDVPMTEVLRRDAEIVPSEWYLQTHATNPLLTAATVERALDAMQNDLGQHDSLFSVTRMHTRLFDAAGRPLNHDPAVLVRTQDLPPVFEENSNLYLFTADQIAGGRRIGERPLLFEVDPLEAIDIVEEHDFVLAESIGRLRIRPSGWRASR
jgi:CMP-N-acetylneuraminic acid synthetase